MADGRSEVLPNAPPAPLNVTYVIIITANECSKTINVVATVNPTPVLSSTLTPPPICSGSTFGYNATSATAGATFAWTRASVAGITEIGTPGTGNVSETLTNTTTVPINVIYVYITTANGCISAPQNVVVVVNPIPVLNSTVTPAAICSGSAFNYTATSPTVWATFTWSRPARDGITHPGTTAPGGTVSTVLAKSTKETHAATCAYHIVIN